VTAAVGGSVEDAGMSLKPQEEYRVPDEPRRVALAAFPRGCACLRIADAVGWLKSFFADYVMEACIHDSSGWNDKQARTVEA
jgi:hypothetical protein